MDADPGASLNVHAAERAAKAYHRREAREAVDLWVDGVNLLREGMNRVSGRIAAGDEKPVLLLLLVKAWNSTYCALDLALRGYPAQSLNLLRSPIEDWTAYLYLRCFPHKFDLFSDPSKKTPEFRELVKDLEKKTSDPDLAAFIPQLKAWIKPLHPFSHVDIKSVLAHLREEPEAFRYLLGPDQDAVAFSDCAGQATLILDRLTEAANNLGHLVGLPQMEGLDAYADRVIKWQDARRAATPTTES